LIVVAEDDGSRTAESVPLQLYLADGLVDYDTADLDGDGISEAVVLAEDEALGFVDVEARRRPGHALVELLDGRLLQLGGVVGVALVLEDLDAAAPRRGPRALDDGAVGSLSLPGDEDVGHGGRGERVAAAGDSAVAV